MSPLPSPFDLDMMAIALRVAERGLGNVAPNPAVGAVIANAATGEVIARGWTQPGGRPHAETEAIRRAGVRARGATMYVTLEPCAHHGKTPPCADAIIAAGLKRVVVGVGDPDLRTAGEGVARLRSSGIEVLEKVREDEACWLTLGHILRVTQGRPFVTLKMATDAQGNIPRGDGAAPVWATGPEARAAGHLLRARADAILVGAGTVLADDPDLTCRLPGLEGRSPDRIVMWGRKPFPADRRLVKTAGAVPVILIRPEGFRDNLTPLREAGVTVIEPPIRVSHVSPDLAVGLLAERGCTRLLVEGGPVLWRAFSEAGLADEVALFIAGHTIDTCGAEEILTRHLGAGIYKLITRRSVGADTMLLWARDPVAGRAGQLAGVQGH